MTTHTKNRPVEILLVEDNLGDIQLLKEIMKTSRFPIHWTVARDGEQALEMLHDRDNYSGQGEPDIILLDLNLPKVDGRDVLDTIKKDRKLKHVPVLVMTSSQDSQDITDSYRNHANFYIVKPMDMDHFRVVVKYIEDFWLHRIKLQETPTK
jgi:CheY-like chemotaxis protein